MVENGPIFQIVTWFLPLVLAITLHEVAHGLAAYRLGDPTAHDAGRLSLDPLKHVDPVGTIILPLIMVIAHAPVFGWAKPVPVNMRRLRNPRWGGLLVTAAGPGSNFALAVVGAAALAVTSSLLALDGFWPRFIAANLGNFVLINLFLGVFNLIPVPPFDGGHIVAALLPPRLGQRWAALGRYGLAIMMLLLVVLPSINPNFNLLARIVEPPVAWLAGGLHALFGLPRVNGWLIVDKPVGIGSTDVVSKVKRALREGGYPKVKVGHGGTLDPLASGVLPVALGEATKLAGRMLDASKVYEFTIGFGTETDTLDAEGSVVAISPIRPTLAQVEAMLPRFTGPIEQVPPVYSALKVDGRRAYDLARAGEDVVLATRAVVVHHLALSPCGRGLGEGSRAPASVPNEVGNAGVEPASPIPSPQPSPTRGEGVDTATLVAHVSKGTYIRSLARDIAHALGTFGHVTYLRRTRAGPFDLAHAISLDKLADLAKAHALGEVILPLRAGLDDIPAFSLTPDQAAALRQGRTLIGTAAHPGLNLALFGETPVALVEADGPELRVVRGFNLPDVAKDD